MKHLSIVLSVLLTIGTTAQSQSITLQRLSLPKGPGTITGVGESFAPQLSTGSANYQVRFELPPGPGSLTPDLSLTYHSDQGLSNFGLGWDLSLDSIKRSTRNGVPSYSANDTYECGGQELVQLADQTPTFLAENQTDFARYRIVGNGWEKSFPNGTKFYFGNAPTTREGQLEAPAFNQTSCWQLSHVIDVNGNRIDYQWEFPSPQSRARLKSVRYGKSDPTKLTHHQIDFSYRKCPPTYVSFNAGFKQEISSICTNISIQTFVDGRSFDIRQYVLELSSSSVPLLKSVTQRDPKGNILPPARFEYRSAELKPETTLEFNHKELVPVGVQPKDLALCDLNHDGLTDVCYSTPGEGWWVRLSRGEAKFGVAVRLQGKDRYIDRLSLRDQRTQLVDITGDGRVDLVSAMPNEEGDRRVVFYELKVGVDEETPTVQIGSRHVFENTCAIDLSSKNTRVFDVDFNKCIDFVKFLDDSLVVAKNRQSTAGNRVWQQLEIPFTRSHFPNDMPAPGMRLCDVNGDRLMDFLDVHVETERIQLTVYYGNGSGEFSKAHAVLFEGDGGDATTTSEVLSSNVSKFEIADVNSDGLSDLISVIPGKVRIWLSTGNAFSKAVDLDGPQFDSQTNLYLTDFNGNGSTDLVFFDPNAKNGFQFQGLDVFPIGRGNLLNSIDNGIGRVVSIEYRPATDFQTAAAKSGEPWQQFSPIVTHVISAVRTTNSLDLDQDGEIDEQVSNFVYSDPYYDGHEKQFRGYALVTEIDWGDDAFDPDGFDSGHRGSATTVTRHRYHTGAPSPNSVYNHVAGYDEEALKGRLLCEEICGLSAVKLNDERTSAVLVAGQKGGYCSDSHVYRRTTNEWEIRQLYTTDSSPALNSYSTVQPNRVIRDAQLKQQDVQHIEGPNVAALNAAQRKDFAPRVIRTETEFNEFGGLTKKKERGNFGKHAIRGNARSEIIEYAHGGLAFDQWILDRVAQSTLRNQGDQVVSGQRFFYGDANDSFSVEPFGEVGKRALKIRTEGLLIPDAEVGIEPKHLEENKWVQRSVEAFDQFGNTTWHMDGMANVEKPKAGHARQFEYDRLFHTFPISETVFVSPERQLRAKASFDVAFGTITELVDVTEGKATVVQDRVAGIAIGEPRRVRGHKTSLGHDSHGRLTAIVRPGDSFEFPTEQYRYAPADARRKLQYLYDAAGTLTTKRIEKDHKWTINLGVGNGEISSQSGLSAVATFRREATNKLGTIGAASLTDGLGRLIAKVGENSATSQLLAEHVSLDNRGNPAESFQPYASKNGWRAKPNARSNKSKRDPLGRITETAHPKDANGVVASTRTLYLPLTERRYDEEDNRNGKHRGTFTDFKKDGFGRLTGVIEHVRLSDDGESVAEMRTWPTRYRYDPLDNLTGITDAQNNVTYQVYDSLSRRRKILDPDRGERSFEYDLSDNLTLRKDARRATVAFTYDGANRKLSETGQLGQTEKKVTFHYDNPKGGLEDATGKPLSPSNLLGRLAWVEDLAGNEHYSYTARGLANWTLREITFDKIKRRYLRSERFDTLDRIIGRQIADSTGNLTKSARKYNRRGLLGSIHLDGIEVIRRDYFPNGVVRRLTHGNGTSTVQSLDHRLRLQALSIGRDFDRPQRIHNKYTYDFASNLTAIEDARTDKDVPFNDSRRNTQRFQLDDAYRLRKASFYTGPNGTKPTTSIAYTCDRIGNHVNKTAIGVLPEDGHWKRSLGKGSFANRRHRDGSDGKPGPHAFLGAASGSTLHYDKAGSVTAYDGNKLQRDAWGRISRVIRGGSTIAIFVYDHAGRRVVTATEIETVLYPYEEIRDSTTKGVRTYLAEDGKKVLCVTEKAKFYYHHDHLDSHILTTGKDGAVLEEFSYLPYGTLRHGSQQNKLAFSSHVRFAGKEYDAESGLHYFENRFLAPAITSFVSCDPVMLSAKSELMGPTTASHAYAYSARNPHRFVDPDGRIPVDTIWDGLCVIYDLGKMSYASLTDNPKMMSEARIDLAMDIGAMLIPYAPAGMTKVIKGIDKATDAKKVLSNPAGVTKAIRGGKKAVDNAQVLSDRVADIAKKTGLSRKQVKDRIHRAKRNLPKHKTKNPDVGVDPKTGEIFPKSPLGGYGDSIGNIFENY